MKLSRKNTFLIGFTLFSMFFGAGNLIFPPFLGQNAAEQTLPAFLGFLVTAVVLPVLGLIVVARFDGVDRLSQQVGDKFSRIYTLLLYISLGPGLAIPRAASVPFEMAVAPYLPESANFTLWLVIYSLVFFLISLWLSLNPGKLLERIGMILTPMLLILIFVLFGGFLVIGTTDVTAPQAAYESGAFLQGFIDGYQTMDTLAALNFGLVITTTLATLGVREKKPTIRYTTFTGIVAGAVLALVYMMLAYMGMQSSGVYPIQDNGAWTLRCIVYQIFGDFGAILLAGIFVLACLTTCVGLINSISQYFSTVFPKLTYRQWVYLVVGFSFLICNMGLTAILSISVPILNAIYPVSIMLIMLGLSGSLWEKNPQVYPIVIFTTGCVSVLHAVESAGVPLGALGSLMHRLPLYSQGFTWVIAAVIGLAVSLLIGCFRTEK